MTHSRSAIAALGALLLVTTACAATDSEGAGGDTFTLAMSGDPGSLDPAKSLRSHTNTVLSIGYDTLVSADTKNRTVPGLATSWQVKPSSVTFTLRKGVTCADGSPVKPSTVAANIDYVTRNKAPIYGVLVPPGLTAKADDAAGTVTFATPTPFSFILESARTIHIVCGKGLADRSLLARGTSGSGPYQLTHVRPGDRYTFRLREDYAWGAGGATSAGMPKTFVLKIVASEQTAANLLIGGNINAALVQGPDRIRLKALSQIKTREIPTTSEQFNFHQGKGKPTADPAVRKALVQALNLKDLAMMASSGEVRPAGGMVAEPRPCPGDDYSRYVPPHDTAKAEAGLDAAGWRKGSDGVRAKDGRKLKITLLYALGRGESAGATVEYTAAVWKKIGVKVEIKAIAGARISEVVGGTTDWDAGFMPLGVGLPSQLIGVFTGPTPPTGGNFVHAKNAQYASLVTQAMRTPGAAGCVLWNKAEKALVENHDIMPVVGMSITLATRDGDLRIYPGVVFPTTVRLTEGE
ncbi:ABC transporter substrate-binding protein [Streptomyces sp. NPDC055078]